MRKIAIIVFVLLVLLLGGAEYFLSSRLPDIAHVQASKILKNMGFQSVKLPEPKARFGVIWYENASLDEDQISTIKRLEIRYDPIKLFFKKPAQSLHIKGLNLTGELTNDGKISIAGWDNHDLLRNTSILDLKSVEIRDSNISLLTPNFGGFSFEYSIQARNKGDSMELQAHAQSKQKKLSFTANASGQIHEKDGWQMTVEIEQGKFETPDIKASRVNGRINLEALNHTMPKMISELRAGGLTLYGFPWQNASGTIEGSAKDHFQVFLDAKSIGFEGLELSLNLQRQKSQTGISGTVHTENFGNFLDYLEARSHPDLSLPLFKKFRGAGNIDINFETRIMEGDPSKNIIYSLKNDQHGININGLIDFKSMEDFTARINSAPLSLAAVETLLKSQNLHFIDGHIILSGQAKPQEKNLSGFIKADIKNGAYSLDNIRFEQITGPLVFDKDFSLTTENPVALSCTLPFTESIRQSCAISAKLTEGRLTVGELELGLFNGILKIRNYTPGAAYQSLTLEDDRIDLWEFSKALGFDNFSATGLAKVKLPLSISNGRIQVKDGKITTVTKGIIRYIYDRNPDFFKGDEFDQEAMRLALENYHYEFFEIHINGPLTGEPDLMITARGFNPDLLERRPVALHFNTKASLAPLFKNIIAK